LKQTITVSVGQPSGVMDFPDFCKLLPIAATNG
jgi:hypothetical protein